MYRFLLIVFLMQAGTSAISQDEANSYLYSQFLLGRLSGLKPSAGIIPGIPISRAALRGSAYLDEHFALATFLLASNATTDECYAKYDIFKNEFHVITPRGALHVLSGDQVRNFYWIDSTSNVLETFVNAKQFKNETGEPDNGFYQVLSNGPLPLVKKTEGTIKDPNYALAFDVGSKDYRMLTKERLLYIDGDTAMAIPPPKKIPMLFKEYSAKMQLFIEMNEMDLKNELHLTEVFKYFNAIAVAAKKK